jgi:DNA mismatch repair protein MLH1
MFILFINNRLVECSELKKAIDQLYGNLSKNYFCYLALQMDEKLIDVNVHPTKKLVHFMNQSDICAFIVENIEKTIKLNNASRSFKVEPLILTLQNKTESPLVKQDTPRRTYDHYLVRTDNKVRKLDSFYSTSSFSPNQNSMVNREVKRLNVKPVGGTVSDNVRVQESKESGPSGESGSVLERGQTTLLQFVSKSDVKATEAAPPLQIEGPLSSEADHDLFTQPAEILRSISIRSETTGWNNVTLTSILELREQLESNSDESMQMIFQQCLFVGSFDERLALIQHETRLIIVNVASLSQSLAYQFVLDGFSNFGRIWFERSMSVYDLAMIYLDNESDWTEELEPKEDIASVFLVDVVDSNALVGKG